MLQRVSEEIRSRYFRLIDSDFFLEVIVFGHYYWAKFQLL